MTKRPMTEPSSPVPALRNIRLTVSYDGTDFSGWQRQKSDRSVQEELERALAKMHGHEVLTYGAGRTDSGVHAHGQVANFYTDIASIPADRFVPALNGLLPRDVRILDSRPAPFDFHSRFDAASRRYRYFTLVGQGDPWRLRYAHQLFKRPDIAVLNGMPRLVITVPAIPPLSSPRCALALAIT